MTTTETDLNSTDVRTDIPGEVYQEGDLPQLGGIGRATLQPGTNTFRLPLELPQLWKDLDVTRDGVKYRHLQLRFDKDHPLVVIGGPHDGAPFLASFSSVPRPRGRKDDPATPHISDLALVLEVGLGNTSRPLAKGGPEGLAALKAATNAYAGKTLRFEHGLSAQCRPDKVRYIFTNDQTVESKLDPTGTHGCGQRHYTKAFKAPSVQAGEPAYDVVIPCSKCGAAIRGFESVERILPPVK